MIPGDDSDLIEDPLGDAVVPLAPMHPLDCPLMHPDGGILGQGLDQADLITLESLEGLPLSMLFQNFSGLLAKLPREFSPIFVVGFFCTFQEDRGHPLGPLGDGVGVGEEPTLHQVCEDRRVLLVPELPDDLDDLLGDLP